MSGFLHGVETIQTVIGTRPITVVKTAVVMLIGYAPLGPAQTLTLVQGPADFAQFGAPLGGFTIPQALPKILANGAGTIIVNNIYSAGTNDAAVVDEVLALVGGKGATAFHPTNAVVVKNSAGSTTYVAGTDYSIDVYGNIKTIGSTITATASLKLTYHKFDPTTVTSTAITGAVSGDTRTGLLLFDEARTQFGFSGKILICPVYCSITAVTTAMVSYITNKRACTLIHAPVGTSKANANAGRGSSGSINFATQDKRAMLIFPWVKDSSPIDDSTEVAEPTAYFAGVMCFSDITFGPQRSLSNQEIIGPLGTEITITDDINDQNSDANLLNSNGISTISMGSGAPFTWGNRGASYPNNTDATSFLCVIRIADIVAESIEYYARPKVDQPGSKANVDQVRDDVNNFIRTLVTRGWIGDGSCTYDPNDNPPDQIAAGNYVFGYEIDVETPMERITFKEKIGVFIPNVTA